MDKEKIIYGRNPVLEYIRSTAQGSSLELFVNQGAHGKIIQTILGEAKKKGIRITYPEKKFFSSLGSSTVHQGVVLKGIKSSKIPGKAGSDYNMLLDEVSEKRGVLVLLDQLTDPHNVGSIIRTAEALGCDGILLTKSHSSGISPTVIKSSAGATAHIPVISISNISGFISRAREAGFWLIGTSGDGDTVPGKTGSLRPVIIIIGSEDRGMRKVIEESCDFIAGIKLRGRITSLNASVAAGIIIHEVMKTEPA